MKSENTPFAQFFNNEMFVEFNKLVKPAQELLETNTKMLETLVSLQKNYLEDLTNTSMEQFKALCECKDPKAALDIQVKFYKTVEAKMADTAEKGISAITEAKDSYIEKVEESSRKAVEMAEQAAKKVTAIKAA